MALIIRVLLLLSGILMVSAPVVPVWNNQNPGVDQLFFRTISPFTSPLFPPSTSQSKASPTLALGQVLFPYLRQAPIPFSNLQQSSSQINPMAVAPDRVNEEKTSPRQKRPKTRKVAKKNKQKQDKRDSSKYGSEPDPEYEYQDEFQEDYQFSYHDDNFH